MITAARPIQDAARIAKWQFGVRSLLWLMLTAGMCLAYARLFGDQALLVMAATPLIAIVFGLLFGAVSRPRDTIYWALVGATLASVCAIAAPISGADRFFWPMIGGFVGALAGGSLPVSRSGAVIVCFMAAAVSGLAGIIWWAGRGYRGYDATIDMLVAAAAAPALTGVVYAIEWLRSRRANHATSRDAWAAGLVLAVIAGNLVAAAIGGRLF